jgi:phosphoadenosine phosphosulfate reductase
MSGSLDSRATQLKQVLRSIADEHAPAVFSSSLSAEDMVVADAILTARLDIEIFTLDTGRLHGDTLKLVGAIHDRYDYQVKIFTPDADAIASYESQHGRDAFYSSSALRHECCRIRKVEPLKHALKDKKAWITGLRREHSAGRAALPQRVFDDTYRLAKFNPLADWTDDQVWEYLRAYAVPYNALYDQGYRSIGCAPCTRPVVTGEDIRAGRWWWEQDQGKECGLHVREDGKLVRSREAA